MTQTIQQDIMDASGVYNVTLYDNARDTKGKPADLLSLLKGIKFGTWKEFVERLRSIQDEIEQKLFKNILPCFTASGIFLTRKSSGLVKHSDFIAMDTDVKNNPILEEPERYNEIRQKLIRGRYTYCLFTSCRGKGLAVVIRIDGTKHLKSFKFLEKYYRDTYGLVVDKACKDVTRLRFVSYDPDLYLNENAEIVIVPPDFTEEPKHNYTEPAVYSNGRNSETIKAIIASGKPFANDYPDWLRIGQALAHEFGEAGREYFHALSQMSPKYNSVDCDKKFDNCLKTNRGDVTFATIVHLAREAGALEGVSSNVCASLQTPKECGKYNIKISTILDMLQYEPPEYLIRPILYKNTVNLLQSLPGIGKSVAALSFADAITSNKPLWGHFDCIEKGKVLIVDEENPGSIYRDRLEKMGIHRDAPIHFIHYQGIKVDKPGWLESLIKLINEEKYVLVIFDALIRMHSAKENDSDEMSKVMRAFREIVRRGITTVVIIHHERKSRDGEKRERSRGSGDIVGAIDSQLILEEGKVTDDGKELILHPGKTRLKAFTPIRLVLNTDTLNISYKGNALSSTKGIIQQIVQFLGDKTYCYEEIQDVVQIPDKQLRTILKNALGKELILDGTLKQKPDYKGSPKKQFYKVKQNPLLSNVATFPPIGVETCHIEESRPVRNKMPGNVESLDFVECGDVSKHGLPHETLTKKHVSGGAKKEGVGNIENESENVSVEPINLDMIGVEL